MCNLEEELKKIIQWAENHEYIKKAYFFGSRYKGSNRSDSDIDIAIELILEGTGTLSGMWHHIGKDLQEELQRHTKFKAHLQWYENKETTPTMHTYLNEASVVIYEQCI